MLLYAEHITARLQYIVAYLEQYLFESPVKLTQDAAQFLQYKGPKINYSKKKICENEWFLRPAGLLEQEEIVNLVPTVDKYLQRIVLFPQQQSDHPFDIFSALFYVLSRYEEYLPHAKDAFGRFSHEDSLAWKHCFLNIPLADYWMADLKTALQERFSDIRVRNISFSFTPTYDIDIAWSYLHKGFMRNMGGMLRDVTRFDVNAVSERIAVLMRKQSDPFDVYDWLENEHRTRKLRPVYFFLLSKLQHPLDKNIHPHQKALQLLVQQIGKSNQIGLHPSMHSNKSNPAFMQEVEMFKQISGSLPLCSRQHYLHFDLPNTYQRLLAAGISEEYSMGYGTVNGFRASTSKSFYWYDLQNETATNLLLHPMAFMDANAFYESKSSVDVALQELKALYASVKAVNGNFITLFHNHILGSASVFRGWRNMYLSFLDHVSD